MWTPDFCPECGKRRYLSRGDARRIARQRYPGGRLNAYQCNGFWHLGHLPKNVVRGRMTRDDITPPATTEEER